MSERFSSLILPAQPFAKTDFKLGLYPVVDSFLWIERLISAGVKTLQIRLKNQSSAEAETEIVRCIELARRHQVRLFVNDFWQLAIKHRAYGVHLGQEDLQTADLNAIQQAGLRLGVSTHSQAEIDAVLPLRPSYIACGHIFPTKTKQMPSQPQGLAALAEQVRKLGTMPTVAIGGIKEVDFPAVLATGVGSIAVVTAITEAADWKNAVKKLMSFFDE